MYQQILFFDAMNPLGWLRTPPIHRIVILLYVLTIQLWTEDKTEAVVEVATVARTKTDAISDTTILRIEDPTTSTKHTLIP